MPIPLNADLAMAVYIVLCLVCVLTVYSFAVFDRRALASELDDELRPISFFERPDRALLILFFGIAALGIAAYAGWRLPLEMARFLPEELPDVIDFGAISEPLSRAAQVVGATCFFMIALRMLRLSLIIAFALTMMVLGIAAYTYVFV